MKPKFVLVIFGCAVGLFLAEISIRLLWPGYVASADIERDYFCQFDPEIGWRPLPNISGRHQVRQFSVFVHQNQFGLRAPDSLVREKTSSHQRMLVLGDSFVWGYGVNQREIFTHPEVHNSKTELINFGVSGYGTDQEYLFYLREGPLFEVDEVLLVLTPYNDIENNLSEEQYDKFKPFFTLSDNRLIMHTDHIRNNNIQGVINWTLAHSRVANLMDTSQRIFLNWWSRDDSKRGVPKEIDGILDSSEVSGRDRQGMQLTIHIIEALRKAVQANNARFSVVFIPYKPHIVNHYSYNHPLVLPLAKKLEEANIDYYEPYFFFLREKEAEKLFNEFDNHFSPAGHALFGKVLVRPSHRGRIKNLYSHEQAAGQQRESVS